RPRVRGSSARGGPFRSFRLLERDVRRRLPRLLGPERQRHGLFRGRANDPTHLATAASRTERLEHGAPVSHHERVGRPGGHEAGWLRAPGGSPGGTGPSFRTPGVIWGRPPPGGLQATPCSAARGTTPSRSKTNRAGARASWGILPFVGLPGGGGTNPPISTSPS